MIKLDYSLKTPEERCALVEQILAEPGRTFNNRYLEILSDYIIDAASKEDIKKFGLMTNNRMATITKRETSFEGLVSQFENGEDGIYDLINENGKNTIFKPKDPITDEEIAANPDLKAGADAIAFWEEKLKTARGKDAYTAKKAIIDLRKDQYIIRDAFRHTVMSNGVGGSKSHHHITGHIEMGKDGNPVSHGITLIDPAVICAILCNYEALTDVTSLMSPNSDLWCLIEDFNNLQNRALRDYPVYKTICECKINNLQNVQIQEVLKERHNISYTVEYISSLWRNKIPELIADCAIDEYINWYYTNKEQGKYKKCNRCGKVKLAHNRYFSKNKSSKDGWYSICKECRNNKGKIS